MPLFGKEECFCYPLFFSSLLKEIYDGGKKIWIVGGLYFLQDAQKHTLCRDIVGCDWYKIVLPPN